MNSKAKALYFSWVGSVVTLTVVRDISEIVFEIRTPATDDFLKFIEALHLLVVFVGFLVAVAYSLATSTDDDESPTNVRQLIGLLIAAALILMISWALPSKNTISIILPTLDSALCLAAVPILIPHGKAVGAVAKRFLKYR